MSKQGISELERIDTHAHVIPPKYREFLIQTGNEHVDGWPELPAWTPEQHIAMMKDTNVTTAILSISTPSTYLWPSDARSTKSLTRLVNQELSDICKAHPDHFRFFACLPLPFVSESLEEIDYAMKLGAVGFCVLSNANGVYLGDKFLDPIFAKINEYKTIVFIHPTSCKAFVGTEGGIAGSSAVANTINPLSIPSGLLEYMFDETRSVANLLVSGTVMRCPDIKFIMSHAGSVLPPILERVAVGLQKFFGGKMGSSELKELLRERFHFDLAGQPWPDMIHGILRVVGTNRLLYGSDYCWTPVPMVQELNKEMDAQAEVMWGIDITKDVYAGNARKLFGLQKVQSISG